MVSQYLGVGWATFLLKQFPGQCWCALRACALEEKQNYKVDILLSLWMEKIPSSNFTVIKIRKISHHLLQFILIIWKEAMLNNQWFEHWLCPWPLGWLLVLFSQIFHTFIFNALACITKIKMSCFELNAYIGIMIVPGK